MDRIREQITKPVLIAAGVGLLLGLVLGILYAWVIDPVEWENAAVQHLREDLQRDYLAMSVQTFAQTGNVQEAQRRWAEMGDDREQLLGNLQTNPPAPLSSDMIGQYAAAVQAGALPGAQPGLPGTVDEPAGAPANLTWALVLMCLLTLGIGGVLLYLFAFRNRRPAIASNRGGAAAMSMGRADVDPATYSEGQEPPIVQYLTSYTLGNDLYDDSFSIDSPNNGEFLGECGVGISDTIGVGDPKKVTAFEVWLFDKNDIQTVTKVLMSQHAFNDPSINQRLASKGEPVLVEPGKTIILETATLQLQARVVTMNYGQGALPANSFFDQMTLELAVWPKA
jgi:hypothetical protein